jgi:ABC-type sugar transport system substrate-binding protein
VAHSTYRGRAVAATLTAAVAVAVAGCGSSDNDPSPANAAGNASQSHPAGKTVRLGFSVLALSIPGLQDTANALKAAGQQAGIDVTVADPKFNVQTQVQQVQQWIQLKQVEAIWVIPIAPAAMMPVIKQAQAARIPILVDAPPAKAGFDGAAPGVSFSSTDYVQFGTDLGEQLQKCISARLGNAPTKIIYETDPSGQTSDADTRNALKAAIVKIPGASIVREVSVANQLAAQQSVSSALQAAPDANVAVGTNDEAALGAMQAFQQAGKDPAKLCVIGGGAAVQSVAAIQAGTIYAGVTFDFVQDTKNNVGEILAMAADPTAAGRVMTVPISVVAPR